MIKEKLIRDLQNYDIQHLRIKAREYGITPLTKKSAKLIEEITNCIIENKKQTQSGRGRKPKNNCKAEISQPQKTQTTIQNQVDDNEKYKALIDFLEEYQRIEILRIENIKNLILQLMK